MRSLTAALLSLGTLALATRAAAHLELRQPPSRYGGNVLKTGPCGAADGQRSTNVSVLEPGATLELVWDEYVDHPGHFRVAFDDDGDDDFRDPACLSGCDTRNPRIELDSDDTVLLDGIADTNGGTTRISVTLPDIECDNCTLQVIQVMYDKPPYTSPGNDIYYQCADLVLRYGAGGAGGMSTGGGSGATGTSGTAGMGAVAGTAGQPSTDSEASAGCSIATPPATHPRPWLALLALASLALLRTRR